MQANCMTWLFAYFDVSWVVHGWATVASSMLGQGCHGGEEGPGPHAGFPWTDSSSSWPIRMPSSSNKSWNKYFTRRSSVDLGKHSSFDLGKHSSVELGSAIGR